MLGKDYWVAGTILWWLWTRRESLVIATGPGQASIGSILWKEVRRAVASSPFANTPGGLPVRISSGVKTSPHFAEVRPGWSALGFSTTSVERASGQHAGQLLVIVEEASGVEDHMWEALDSLGATRMVAIGNPIRAEGGFARLCDQGDHDVRDGVAGADSVRHIRVPSTASPHARLKESPVGLASAGWLDRMYRKWGRDSAWVKAHIDAIRPAVAEDVLLPDAWLDWAAAHARPLLPAGHPIHATRRIACDLAEGVGRDSSCILVRDDWGVLDVTFGSALGLPEAAAIIARKASEYGVPAARITYDRLGIGKDFAHHLARHGLGQALGYTGPGKPRSADYVNLRTEAAWRLRRRLDPGHVEGGPGVTRPAFAIPSGPYWPRLREELRTLTYSFAGPKIRLMDKDDHCTVLGHSPDIADALMQSMAFD